MLIFLASFTLAAATLMRRPGVVVPGLAGGVLVALAWLAMRRFTFYGAIAPMTAPFTPLVPMVVVPLLVGAVGTLRGRSSAAAAGKLVIRLAGRRQRFGLGPVPVREVIAVVVLGPAGPCRRPGLDRRIHHQRPAQQQHGDREPGGDPAGDRHDRLGQLPRPPPSIRPRLAASMVPVPFYGGFYPAR